VSSVTAARGRICAKEPKPGFTDSASIAIGIRAPLWQDRISTGTSTDPFRAAASAIGCPEAPRLKGELRPGRMQPAGPTARPAGGR
jgi:hypothetical protein